MSIKFTDVKPMIENKLLRNTLAIDLINTHKEIFKKDIEIRQSYIESCDTKVHLLETINLIERLQLNEYDKVRENSITEIIKDIDEIDKDLIVVISDIYTHIKIKKDLAKIITMRIEELNKSIPKEGIATNYKINFKDSLGGRCIP